jgi:putative integral membrane protein (TIGR02587 family)
VIRTPHQKFALALARAAGGSILFTVPLLMTMEMWWLGFYMEPLRLALLIAVTLPVLAGLAYYSGFEKRITIRGAVVDAFVAYAVGTATAGVVLALLSQISSKVPTLELLGKITLQTIPGAIGAVLAASELGGSKEGADAEGGGDRDSARTASGYPRELFLMVSGALFFAFNIAPTEEVVVIAQRMTSWHSMAMVLVSLLIMHSFVYSVGFHGQKARPDGHSRWATFARFTIVGYVLALTVSLYCLWSFGRTEGDSLAVILAETIALGFPAAIGAASARLIL